MRGRSDRWRSAIRACAIQLALASLILRALIPSGWMPAPAGAAAPLIICTGHGALAFQPADARPRPTDHHDRPAAVDLCQFAGAAHLAPPVWAALALSAPPYHPWRAPLPRRLSAPAFAARRAYHPRAPPAFA